MLTFEDCLALAELTEEEILAIAQHEHIPELAALELGNYLVHAPKGEKRIKRIILDDLDAARRAGDPHRVIALKLVLKHFCAEHHV